MADYHIYIHDKTGGNASDPKGKTVPKSPSVAKGDTSPNGGDKYPTVSRYVPGSEIINAVSRFGNALNGSGSLAFSALSLAILVAKTVEKCGTAVNDYVATQTGDYSSKLSWDNAMQDMNNLFHPVSSSINAFLTQERYERSDKAKAEERSLFGDAQLNTLTKGV